MSSPFTELVLSKLIRVVGPEHVLTKAEDILPYGFDGTAVLKQRPAAVVFPANTQQVAACVQIACDAKTSIVTRGSGTGLSGGSVPSEGCIVLCLLRMDAILDVDPRNLTVRAQPGVITLQIDEAAGAGARAAGARK